MRNIHDRIETMATSKDVPLSLASAKGSPLVDDMLIIFCMQEYPNGDIATEAWMFGIFQNLHRTVRQAHPNT